MARYLTMPVLPAVVFAGMITFVAATPVIAGEIRDETLRPDAESPGSLSAVDPSLAGSTGGGGVAPLQQSRQYIEGQQAIERGDPQAAFDIFMDLLREYLDSIDINCSLGRAAYLAGKYAHAALAFERVIATDARNDGVRLELARTYFSAKQFDPARREFERVLANSPPETVRKSIQAFLDEMGREEERVRLFVRVDIGGFYDGNANVGPDSEVINIAPIISGAMTVDSLTVSEGTLPVKSWGGLACLSASTSYDIGRRDMWALTCDGIMYNSWLEEHAAAQEVFLASIKPGFSRAWKEGVLRLPVKAEHISRGSGSLVNIYGTEPSLAFVWGQGAAWYCVSEVTAENRDYTDLKDRSGPYFALGSRVGRYMRSRIFNFYGGATVFYEKTDAGIYRNAGVEALVGSEIRLPWQVTGYVSAKYRTAQYSAKEALAPETRRDDQYQFSAGLRRILWRRCGGDLNYQRTVNSSSFDLYGYSRDLATLNLSYSF